MERFVSYEQRVKRIVIRPSDYALETDKEKKAPPLGSVLVDMQHTSSDEEDDETSKRKDDKDNKAYDEYDEGGEEEITYKNDKIA